MPISEDDQKRWVDTALGRKTLATIGKQHGTDKVEHGYLPWYDNYLAPWRDKPIKLLELGVWNGASLRMWREYFPEATIFGLDNVKRDIDTKGCIVAIGKQDSKTSIDALTNMFAPFSVIIDDASHVSSKTIRSFELLFPHLAPGGLYVIEDLQTSYDTIHYGTEEACPHPDGAVIGGQWTGYRTAMQFCKRLADETNASEFAVDLSLGYPVHSVQFLPNICFIVKAEGGKP